MDKQNAVMNLVDDVNPNEYDLIIVAFSGGKDSLACILNLLDLGIPKHKIELWHHLIDGVDGDFMDWKVTRSYVTTVARALGLPVYFSWREGGYLGEVLKENSMSKAILFETPTGVSRYEPTRANVATRRMFPMLSNDMNRRFCTSTLKIDVGRIAISHQARFLDKKTLFVTGERAEESANRATYQVFEIHKMDNRDGTKVKRHVDAWRPVHKWTTEQVWSIIAKHKINPHPCYRLGWARCSCAACIFSSVDQLASLRVACPGKLERVAGYERALGHAIHYRKYRLDGQTMFDQIYLDDFASQGVPFASMSDADMKAINSASFDEPIFVIDWKMPPGAKGDLVGPC